MTSQECIWKHKVVRLITIKGKRGPIHWGLAKYCGMPGEVLGDAKNGMLLIKFDTSWLENGDMIRCVPASCVMLCY